MDKFAKHAEISGEEIEAGLEFAAKQILHVLPDFTYKFQPAYSINNFYEPAENTDWTNGFWTGEIWLAYEYLMRKAARQKEEGKEPEPAILEACSLLKETGDIQVESFLNRIEKKISVDHHDMGFLYSPSCVAAYKLTGNKDGRKAAILAADQLITRFHPVGRFIQAWGPMDQPENHRLIIDCLLNVPLLFWASAETLDRKYMDVARQHIHTAVKNVIRDDFSTWHTFFFDVKTGEPDHGSTCQGYRDGSAWSRGQAWGVYGLALAYRYTKEAEYVELFKRVTAYFMEHLPGDLIPYWDLEFSGWTEEELEKNPQPRDTSSASIAACGMLEMAKYLPKEDAEYYQALAKKLLKAVWDYAAVKDVNVSNGLVLHSTYSNHSPYNTCNHYGVDECNSWGDYFYMEALTRLSGDWEQYW